jgi:hypothetical protein
MYAFAIQKNIICVIPLNMANERENPGVTNKRRLTDNVQNPHNAY